MKTTILLTVVGIALTASAAVDPRGPIEYPTMKPGVGADGVKASGYLFNVNKCRKPMPWKAHWIWLSNQTDATRSKAAMFRKEVFFDQTPQAVDAWISADRKYRLYINGRLVSRGPVDIGTDFVGGSTRHWFYDYRDLSAFFKRGTNVIAAEVFPDWPMGYTISRGRPGFIFETEVQMEDGQKVIVQSDQTWSATTAPQYPNASTYIIDNEPREWRQPGFDASRWSRTEEVADIWAPLVPSEMPPLMEVRYPALRIEGLTNNTVTGNGSFRVVFDRVLSAYPTIKVRGGKGAHLILHGNNSAEVILGGGEQYFEFPFMTEIVPTLTVEAKNVTSPIEIEDVGADFTSQPVDYRGSFECNDEFLNRIWKVSRWAVQICMQTHHLDSPNHQEPISDPGDYLIEAMVNYYAFDLPWLARQDIRKFAWVLKDEKYANFHISYSIGWLQMLMDYYDYTGDRALIEEMAPYVRDLMETYASWRGKNGLISEAPNYMFMDWVEIAGFNCHHPPAVIGQGYLTAFYYHGMSMAIRVAGMIGDTDLVEKYVKRRVEIAAAFNRELWVESRGLYRDGKPFQTSVKPSQWLPADKNIETFSPHVNLLAVLYGLASVERQKAIVEKVFAEKPLNTQPWFMHWVFQSLDHAGLFDKYATEQMRRWKIVENTQSFREMWNNGDLSHGWCSTPLVQMSSRVLGVMPATPGWKTLSIRPHLCDLKWARGTVPTPFGDVKVSWKVENDKFLMDVMVPTGCEANVVLPVNHFEHAAVLCNGGKTTSNVHVKSGHHHFEVTGKPLSSSH